MLELLVTAIVAIFIVVLVHWIIFLINEPKTLPPGPLPLPLLGSCYMFAFRDAMDVFMDLHKKYGGAITLYSGCSAKGRLVLLLDWDLLNKTFNAKQYSDGVNEVPENIAEIRGVREGLSWSPYKNYKVRRTFVTRCFKELGLANKQLIEHAYPELEQLSVFIDQRIGEAFNPNEVLCETVSSCILMTVISKRLDLTDPDTAKLFEGARAFFNGNVFQMLMLPYVKFLQMFFKDPVIEGELLMERTMEKWLTKELDQRRDTFHPDIINDFIDAYMAADRTGPMSADHFIRVLTDLVTGAVDTTSRYIGWALYYLSYMPDEQERLFQQIQSTIPENALPNLSYKDKLPRVEAFLNEVFRYGNMTLVGLPRCSKTDDISFTVGEKQYTVPKGSPLWFSSYICQHDERYWRDPNNFRIDRWLSTDGKRLVNHTHWFQFGIGSRCCVGEQVGRNLFFIFVTYLIQRYKWHQVTDCKFEDYVMLQTKIPPPSHKLVFTRRE